MNPLISVIVVTYNRAQYLKDALDSILRQTFKDYEIILVDDGSTDNTKEIVEQYEGIQYIYQEHGGISKARNTAVRVAKGKWIATLDSDDLWKEEKLQKQVDYVRAHPGCRIVYTAFSNFTEIPEDELDERQKDLLQVINKWYLPSALIEAKLFDEIGLYDETLEWCEDTDWVFRLKFSGVNIEHRVDETLYLRRVHNSNIFNSHNYLYSTDVRNLAIDAYRKVKRLRK